MVADNLTKRWIWNAADERAARDGCRFDEARGQHFVDVCEQYFVLWEGEFAGQPAVCTNWEYDCMMRLFGWVRYSEHWKREVRRFRKAGIWIPKKNKKSPSGAKVGLYLTRFDGERGQKVWATAKDGVQAGIVHGHARNMIKASPRLKDMFKVVMSPRPSIVDHDTLSTFTVLAGDNIESQEGLNGSVIIDEAHVVDDRLARVLADMGASRAESLEYCISTAGDSPIGYGRKSYEYGKLVEAGTVHDEAYFFKCYEAPPTTTDKDIIEDPIRIGKLANPAWGETISDREFTAAMNRAQRSPEDWAAFKQRRLNIWQNSAANWLADGVWAAAEVEEIPLDHLAGLGGGVGLDLARIDDLTAAVWVVEYDDLLYLYPRFWIPEERANKTHQVSYQSWHDEGLITIVPGSVTDYRLIQQDIADVCKILKTKAICYDPLFAEEMTQNIHEATGLDRYEFTQNYDTYTTPMEDMERGLIDQTIIHPPNKCFDWQVGNVLVQRNGDKKRPVRDKNQRWKQIDGVQAAIMGLRAHQIVGSSKGNPYQRRGVLVV